MDVDIFFIIHITGTHRSHRDDDQTQWWCDVSLDLRFRIVNIYYVTILQFLVPRLPDNTDHRCDDIKLDLCRKTGERCAHVLTPQLLQEARERIDRNKMSRRAWPRRSAVTDDRGHHYSGPRCAGGFRRIRQDRGGWVGGVVVASAHRERQSINHVKIILLCGRELNSTRVTDNTKGYFL